MFLMMWLLRSVLLCMTESCPSMPLFLFQAYFLVLSAVVAIVVTAFVAIFIVVVLSCRCCQKSGIRQFLGVETTLQDRVMAIFLFKLPWIGFQLHSHAFERLSESATSLHTEYNEKLCINRYWICFTKSHLETWLYILNLTSSYALKLCYRYFIFGMTKYWLNS